MTHRLTKIESLAKSVNEADVTDFKIIKVDIIDIIVYVQFKEFTQNEK
jgi:hypothetical protein